MKKVLNIPWVASLLMLAILLLVGVITDRLNGGFVFWPGFISMMVFYSVIFYIALKAAAYGKGDHILGGRTMPLWLGVFTMSATWRGGGFINGTAEYTYSEGLLWVQAPWGYALSLIVGGLFLQNQCDCGITPRCWIRWRKNLAVNPTCSFLFLLC
ncbi:MAG: hypothetical protein IPL46_02980 [Saprospiraceae bacterium]|nr:hypothetical protein [Saprospiraceae bacterium]